jgi:hypothetical protein
MPVLILGTFSYTFAALFAAIVGFLGLVSQRRRSVPDDVEARIQAFTQQVRAKALRQERLSVLGSPAVWRVVLIYAAALLLIFAAFALVGWIGSPDIARPGV